MDAMTPSLTSRNSDPAPSLPCKDVENGNTSTPKLVSIDYNDLVNFDGVSEEEYNSNCNYYELICTVGKAFGNGDSCLGILTVINIPNVDEYRKALLPLAAKLPYIEHMEECIADESTFYSVGWSHGKEQLDRNSGKDYSKGSFYSNPLLSDTSIFEAILERRRKIQQQQPEVKEEKEDGTFRNDEDTLPREQLESLLKQNPAYFAPNIYPKKSLPELQESIEKMGKCMVQVGILLSKVCQAYCVLKHSTYPIVPLHVILQSSLNCKARLLHYFHQPQQKDQKKIQDALWCGWHKDHSALTSLLPSMYLSIDDLQSSGNNATDTGIQPSCLNGGNTQSEKQASTESKTKNLYESGNGKDHYHNADNHDNGGGGLMIQTRNGNRISIQLPQNQNALGFQIGETFQILSGGILQATPHAVAQNNNKKDNKTNAGDTTRESFAVFMGPEFLFPMDIPKNRTIDDCTASNEVLPFSMKPLSHRWKPGMNYGQFQQATLDAFYK